MRDPEDTRAVGRQGGQKAGEPLSSHAGTGGGAGKRSLIEGLAPQALRVTPKTTHEHKAWPATSAAALGVADAGAAGKPVPRLDLDPSGVGRHDISSTSGATGSATNSAPGPAVQHELRQQLGVPVVIDETGALRDGIELHYVPGPKGTIEPTMMRVGRDAIVDDILAHGDVIGRVTRYNGALGKLRNLWDRLVSLLKRAPQPLKPGTPVWKAYQELRKLDDLIALRQSARMGHGAVSPEILDREIEFFQGYYAHHEAIVAEGEKLGTYGKPAAGHIDSPDGWRDALGGDDPSVGGMHEIDPLGNEPHQNRLPVGKKIDPAVPPAKANSGFWEDEHAKGNTPWHSDNRKLNEITGYKPVEFKGGYPVLDEYTQETVYLKKMLGDERDFIPCDKELAKRQGKFKADGTPNRAWAKDYREKNALTWHHHQDGKKMQLVPLDLHANIPHVGGASATRGAQE